jgi:peptidoglycan glycosyltransferase
VTSSRAAGALAALALVAATLACDRSQPPPGAAVDTFLRAWSELDARAMVSQFAPGERRRWGARRLGSWLRATMRAGEVRALEVERAGSIVPAQGEGPAAVVVPYEITYRSAASSRPAALEGRLAFDLDEARRVWESRWTRGHMWPGVARGRSLDVTFRWPPRARIRDRRGRSLAAGDRRERRYPYGATAGAVVGHVGKVGRERARDAPALVGASGLEGAYERRLAGRPEATLVVVDRAGAVRARLGRRRVERGRPVRATLDIDVQRAAQGALGATAGAAVVLDPSSGDILAAASSGPFDPNVFVGARGVDPFSRALSGLYPPGSAMKVVTASAALQERVVTPTSRLTGPREFMGVRNFEGGTFGEIDFATALHESVNTAFAQVALELGARRLTRYARAFGFERAPEMALAAATPSFPRPADDFDLMWSAIGQAQVVATPLEMASVAATIANDGRRMEPRATFLDAREGARVVSRRTAGTMTDLMEQVVASGTGVRAQVPGTAIAGKTGTAEVDVGGVRRNHAWFVCFAPATAPRIAVSVVAELGGVGGRVAAPIAGRIVQAVLPLVS